MNIGFIALPRTASIHISFILTLGSFAMSSATRPDETPPRSSRMASRRSATFPAGSRTSSGHESTSPATRASGRLSCEASWSNRPSISEVGCRGGAEISVEGGKDGEKGEHLYVANGNVLWP